MNRARRFSIPILSLAFVLTAAPLLAKPLIGCDISLDRTVLPTGSAGKAMIRFRLDQRIVQLQKKIEPDPAKPRILLTVHGVGYRYQPTG